MQTNENGPASASKVTEGVLNSLNRWKRTAIVALSVVIIAAVGAVSYFAGLNRTSVKNAPPEGGSTFTNAGSDVSFALPEGQGAYVMREGMLIPALPTDTNIVICDISKCGSGIAATSNPGGGTGSSTTTGGGTGTGLMVATGDLLHVIIDPDPVQNFLDTKQLGVKGAALFPNTPASQIRTTPVTIGGAPGVIIHVDDPNSPLNIAEVFVSNGHVVSIVGNSRDSSAMNAVANSVGSLEPATPTLNPTVTEKTPIATTPSTGGSTGGTSGLRTQVTGGDFVAAADNPESAYAVGEGGHILHYDGSKWNLMDNNTNTNILYGIWGTRDDNVYAAGGHGTIMHYNGRYWSWVSLDDFWPDGLIVDLYAINGTGDNNIFAVGDRGVILHYDGLNWNRVDNGVTANSLLSVYAKGSDVFVAGHNIVLHATVTGRNVSAFTSLSGVQTDADITAINPSVMYTTLMTGGVPCSYNSQNFCLYQIQCSTASCSGYMDANRHTISSSLGDSWNNMYLGLGAIRDGVYQFVYQHVDENTRYFVINQLGPNSKTPIGPILRLSDGAYFVAGYNPGNTTPSITKMNVGDPAASLVSYVPKAVRALWSSHAGQVSAPPINLTGGTATIKAPEALSPTTAVVTPIVKTPTPYWDSNPSAPVTTKKIVTIDAKANVYGSALDTGVDVSPGDKIEILTVAPDYYKTWSIGPGDSRSCDAGGCPAYGIAPLGAGQFLYGELVGTIGDQVYFGVGTHIVDIPAITKKGRLYLMCWDDVPDDNSGTQTVEIRVNMPDAEGNTPV